LFVDDSRQRPQGFVNHSGIGECRRHVRLEYYNAAACRITSGVLVGPGIAEVVFKENFVRRNSDAFRLPVCLPHIFSSLSASPPAPLTLEDEIASLVESSVTEDDFKLAIR